MARDALRTLAAEILACERCPRLVRCRKQPVPGVGPRRPAVMLVGLAPGRRGADRTGIPFTGDASGRLLRHALARAGVDERSVYVTNVVKCCPNDGRRNLPPSREEIANCLPYLAREIALVRPARIVALGRMAERALAVLAPPHIVAAIPHPGYAVRHARGYDEAAFVRDFAHAISKPGAQQRRRSPSHPVCCFVPADARHELRPEPIREAEVA